MRFIKWILGRKVSKNQPTGPGTSQHVSGHRAEPYSSLSRPPDVVAEQLAAAKELQQALGYEKPGQRVIILTPEEMALLDRYGHDLSQIAQKADQFRKAGRWAEAFRCCRILAHAFPDRPGGWYLCGNVLYHADEGVWQQKIPGYLPYENARKAVEYLDRALELDPNDHDSWYIKAHSLCQIGFITDDKATLKRGLECFDHALRTSPGDVITQQDKAGFESIYRAMRTPSIPGIQEGSESERLINSGILFTFVTQKDGIWNHQDWLNLLSSIRNAGYHTLPEKEVGRILEEAKAKFWRTKWEETASLGAVEPLAAALQHRDSTVQRTAAEVLAKIQDDRATEALASYNLTRWEQSGQPQQWVQGHKGNWNHGDWLSLLTTLKRSEFWPMNLNAVGAVLEGLKREWYTRERPRQQMPLPSADISGERLSRDLARCVEEEVYGSRKRQLLDQTLRELKAAGTQGSNALAQFMEQLIHSRSRVLLMALSFAREVVTTPELVSTVRSTLTTPPLRSGSPGRFQPEIMGDGKVGWTDGTYIEIKEMVAEILSK